MADEVANIAGSKLMPLSELLANDTTLQLALAILVVGIITIVLLSRKLSLWIDTKKFRYHRPYMTKLAKNIMLPLFAMVLIVSITTYVQIFELFDSQIAIDEANASESLTPRETFAKILDTFVVLVMGYTIAQLIPIILSYNETKKMEKQDYREWIHMRGFSDDKQNLFHQLFEWSPPKHGPSEMSDDDYQEKLKNTEGRKFLENYYTSKGVPIGSFKQIKPKTFEMWKKSEREKYKKYL